MKVSSLSIAAAIAVTAFGSSVAMAATPSTGQWSVEVTTGPTNAHFNTVGICLKGDGSWTATSDRAGSGRWLVTRGNVLWRGNYNGGLNDAAVLTASSSTAMSGPLMQWIAGTTDKTNTAIENVYATSTWTFKSATCNRAL